MKKFDIINADIAENISLSKSAAYVNGKKIIVDGGYAGQNADLKITKIRNARTEAVIERVVKKADGQIGAPCAAFGLCGGCRFQDIPYAAQLSLKERYVRNLFEKAGVPFGMIEPIVPSPEIYAYKNKMEFSFGDETAGGPLTLGMHEKKKHHNVVHTEHCVLSPGDFSLILKATEKFFRDNGTPFFNKKEKNGCLRHLVLRHSVFENASLVNLVTTSAPCDTAGYCAMLRQLKTSGVISGILHTINDAVSDTVQSERTDILYGSPFLTEKLCGLLFKISPFCFFQTNTRGAQLLYEKAMEYAGDCTDKTVFDLYCGTGTIALTASLRAKTVYGIEIVAEAVAAAEENARLNGIKNCAFICGDVLAKTDELNARPDVIILDPPRSGIHPKALTKIIGYMPETFVYISCKAQSLIAELPAFIENGYTVEKVCPVDMFPHTEHVETVVLMSRVEK